MNKLKRYNLGELARHYASDKDNVVCRAYDVERLEASHAELLEALKFIMDDSFSYLRRVAFEKALVAIAKAEGTEESHA